MVFDRFWHQTLRRPYRLYSTSHGEAGKPIIVLLHGIAASSDDWGKLIPLLEKHYRCITIDLLGFAQSPKPQWGAYRMEDHVSSIAYTIKKLGVKKPFILVGHSLGSLLATRYARTHQKQVKRLVLLSPPVYPRLSTILKKWDYYRTSWLMKLYHFLRTNRRMTPENMKRLSYIIPVPRSITKFPETWVPFHRSLERCIEQQTIKRDIRDIPAHIDIFYGLLDPLVIASNVQSVAKLKDVEPHTFAGQHNVSTAYAKAVAELLVPKEVSLPEIRKRNRK